MQYRIVFIIIFIAVNEHVLNERDIASFLENNRVAYVVICFRKNSVSLVQHKIRKKKSFLSFRSFIETPCEAQGTG